MSRLVLTAVLALTLSACTPQAVVPMPLPTASPSASPSAPAVDSAEAKLSKFDATNAATIEALGGKPKGRDFIDGLVAAGFDKAAMQLTPDTTAIGLDADNLQFSVQLGQECLVGQFGNVGYHSAILPVIDATGCLIGITRPIDW